MPTDREVLFSQWGFRAELAASVLRTAALHLARTFDQIGSVNTELAFAACAADVAQLVLARDTEGLLSIGDRIRGGTYEPFTDVQGGSRATT